MFLLVICSTIMGISRRKGDFILNVVRLCLVWACKGSKHSFLDQLPSTVETISRRFNLNGKTTTFAACPTCHYTYPPTFVSGSTVPQYPSSCNNCPYPDSDPCGSPLLKDSISDDGTPASKPMKPYVVADFHDYLANLLSRKDLESVMDRRCDDLMASIQRNNQPPNYVSDVFDAEFIRTFEGPEVGKLFVDRPGHEGRYLFAVNVDFFASEGMTLRGANVSSGVISAACLNLPADIRYKREYMYLAAVIPPNEPRLTELNHYIRPVVDQFLVSWERRVHFTQTAIHPTGRDTCSAIATVVCDLPAARKCNQSAGHSSHFLCTRCNCHHKSTIGRTDCENWSIQDCTILRQNAAQWKAATTRKSQDMLFSQNGIRWTELWRLPYWNPTRMLVVDPMHCLLEGLAQFHFRKVLKLTTTDAEFKPAPVVAFEYAFPSPTSTTMVNLVDMTEDEVKQISQIQVQLVSPVDETLEIEARNALLTARLERKKKKSLIYVTESLGLSIPPNKRSTRLQYAQTLTSWVGSPLLCF
jgi:hypothetical protein